MKPDNSQLIGYGIVALIASVCIYNFWQFIVGALALFGIGFVFQHFNHKQ